MYLEFWLPSAGLGVTEEGDECGSECVLLVVVLRAVTVGQLDQAVVVRQPGVRFPETPRPEEADILHFTSILMRYFGEAVF